MDRMKLEPLNEKTSVPEHENDYQAIWRSLWMFSFCIYQGVPVNIRIILDKVLCSNSMLDVSAESHNWIPQVHIGIMTVE